MTRDKLLKALHELQYTACVNQRYHKERDDWWGWWDKGTKITVGILASLSLIACFVEPSWISATASFLSLLAAVVLNVIPFGEWSKQYGALFRRWTDLRTDVEELQLIAKETDESPSPLILWRFHSLQGRRNGIEAEEPAACEDDMRRAQHAENFSRWGANTWEEVKAKRAAECAQSPPLQNAAAAGA